LKSRLYESGGRVKFLRKGPPSTTKGAGFKITIKNQFILFLTYERNKDFY
jgi:hypothetical protein